MTEVRNSDLAIVLDYENVFTCIININPKLKTDDLGEGCSNFVRQEAE